MILALYSKRLILLRFIHSSHETLLHDEEALIKAANQIAIQTRHEIFLTEQTTVVSAEELGWLGIVTAGRHGRHFNPVTSSSSTSAPNSGDNLGMILLKCSSCHRMVIPARREIHQQQCMAMSLSNRHGQPQLSQPTSGYRFPAMLGGALGHHPSIRRGVGSNSGGSGGSAGGGPTKSQHGKKTGSLNRSLPSSDPICAAQDVPTWDPPLIPLPKARTNLSKVSYPYQPESGSLLDDFMESIIDRFVFPHHLKKSRAAGPKRSEIMVFILHQGCMF